MVQLNVNLVKKGKAVPLQAWSGPEGSRKIRFPYFMTMAQDGGKVSLTHRPSLPQEIYQVLISVSGWVDPRAIVWPVGLCHWKIPMTPSGIEPATCRFVAWCLNHYATARLQRKFGISCKYQWHFELFVLISLNLKFKMALRFTTQCNWSSHAVAEVLLKTPYF